MHPQRRALTRHSPTPLDGGMGTPIATDNEDDAGMHHRRSTTDTLEQV